MNPKIFIGSSTEKLEIAYLIQENLEHNAQVTVWTQGVFKLSKNLLDSLVESLSNFDFAIFVFHPDDTTQIRNETFETVRDNIIFELGLFIGRLGKEKVFFLIPRYVESLHLPSDLLGITPGTYDDKREDNNLRASLGPFCNQIREVLKRHIYENLEDIQDEPEYIKKIVIEKPIGWEYLLASDLLKNRLEKVNSNYDEIDNDTIIQRLKTISGDFFLNWYQNYIENLGNFIKLFNECVNGLLKSFGEPGVAGKPIEIKNAVDRILQLCRELINIEYELNSFSVPKELVNTKSKLRGVTKIVFLDEINRLQRELRISVENYTKSTKKETTTLSLTINLPDSLGSVMEDFRKFLCLTT
jgi:hypothetical protein